MTLAAALVILPSYRNYRTRLRVNGAAVRPISKN